MKELYVKLIKRGEFELEKVPPHWYDDVKAQLIEDGFLKEDKTEEPSKDE